MKSKLSLLIFLLSVLLGGTLKAQLSECLLQHPSVDIDNREVPINTHNGLEPNERQIEIIKSTIADDFLVNDDVGSEDQSVPSISMDAVGNFVIVWSDFRNDNGDIYFQRYNDAGTAIGVNTKVNDDTQDASQGQPSISMDATGNFVIVWSDFRNDNNDNNDIYFQRFTSTGGSLGVNTKVNDDVDSTKRFDPSISMDAAGNFVVLWNNYRNYIYDICFQRYTSIGGTSGVNTRVNDDAGNTYRTSCAILIDIAGDFIIVWQGFKDPHWDIYFQRYSSTGGALGVNTKVNDDAGIEFQIFPSISMDVLGYFVIVWQDYRNANADIYYQRYTSTGTALGANIKVNDDAGSMHQKTPSISMDMVGNFVIVWHDNRNGQYNPDIFGQRYYANGNPNGGNYRIVSDGPNEGEISPVVCADNSSIIFSWQDNRRSEGWDIYAKIVGWNWYGVTTEVDEGNINPKDFSLSQNYPNPFNSLTNIHFSLSKFDQVDLSVFNTLGQNVATLVNEKLSAGTYTYSFSDHNLSPGTYLYKLTTASGYSQVKKMIFLK